MTWGAAAPAFDVAEIEKAYENTAELDGKNIEVKVADGFPESVDADKIDVALRKAVLTVTLPKKPEAQKPAKKIEVKSG